MVFLVNDTDLCCELCHSLSDTKEIIVKSYENDTNVEEISFETQKLNCPPRIFVI